MRKYKAIILTLALLVGNMAAFAIQPTTKANSKHTSAHSQLLANQKNRIDKNTVYKFIEQSVKARETSSELPGLSAESAQIINDLLKESNKHLGKKYVWGSKGPNTFDCSGFTSYVYKQLGYNISPGSRMQYTQGVPVKRNDIRKGDLVFFTSRRSGNNVGHVGMVTNVNPDGSFKFIHASVKGVRVSDITEDYYNRRYVGARRIITK